MAFGSVLNAVLLAAGQFSLLAAIVVFVVGNAAKRGRKRRAARLLARARQTPGAGASSTGPMADHGRREDNRPSA